MGTELNLLETLPENCRQIKIKNPILTNEELAKIRYLAEPGFKSATLPMLFPIGSGART
ncbi:MAG: glutamate synthase central domain-containing protein [Caldilineaceae bacterium]